MNSVEQFMQRRCWADGCKRLGRGNGSYRSVGTESLFEVMEIFWK